MPKQLRYDGKSIARVDGIEKVTGKAKFTRDLVIPGMLHGKILRSSYPHARILGIDACRSFEWMKDFPPVAESSPELKEKIRMKWKKLLEGGK